MECRKFDDTESDEDSLIKVREELNETEENRRKCLESLRKKLTEEIDLNPCLDESFLLGYLRVTKFDCNKACQRILRFYDERRNNPNIFEDYLPSSLNNVESARQVYAFPYRMGDNSAIVMMKRGDYDPSKIHYDRIVRAVCMIGDMVIPNPLNQMFGYTFVVDLSTSSWSTWSEYTPSRIKLLARLLQKTAALRIRSLHIINAPSIYYLLYSIAYPLLSSKIRERIIIHKNCESLQSHIGPEKLPKEYGGYLEQSDVINLFERLYKMEDFFETFSKYGYKKKN